MVIELLYAWIHVHVYMYMYVYVWVDGPWLKTMNIPSGKCIIIIMCTCANQSYVQYGLMREIERERAREGGGWGEGFATL